MAIHFRRKTDRDRSPPPVPTVVLHQCTGGALRPYFVHLRKSAISIIWRQWDWKKTKMDPPHTIVEYFAEHDRYRCGYCGQKDTNYSHVMWAHQMSVQDYQDLIDRGWRRSGKTVYKPTMDMMCCPHYTIRCRALDFKLNKSHKKQIKRVNRYLIHGIKPGRDDDDQVGVKDNVNENSVRAKTNQEYWVPSPFLQKSYFLLFFSFWGRTSFVLFFLKKQKSETKF
ncbi:Arginyl-tRNA--protein transferase 1 [Plakobranchus ocellatus]|uniref:Arginyl-tRNA--protein transferase 1 n=1 Tax=Plakobranchus ocellatus TaxID=259542 RepID=A0AAV4C0U8_9GAST|nr:Arginyl-tRNA--protein transferase 1 [Plakobranchus ocellatus]